MSIKLHWACLFFLLPFAACGTSNDGRTGHGHGHGDGGLTFDDASAPDDGYVPPGDGFYSPPDGSFIVQNPKTCDEAAMNKSYIGCDYWPTVTANVVWSIFDFAVVVSTRATCRRRDRHRSAQHQPNEHGAAGPARDALPAVGARAQGRRRRQDRRVTDSLERVDAARPRAPTTSSRAPGDRLSVQRARVRAQGRADGQGLVEVPRRRQGTDPPCFSYSNDASLLLPSTAMTGNYRVVTEHGVDGFPDFPTIDSSQPGHADLLRGHRDAGEHHGDGEALDGGRSSRAPA